MDGMYEGAKSDVSCAYTACTLVSVVQPVVGYCTNAIGSSKDMLPMTTAPATNAPRSCHTTLLEMPATVTVLDRGRTLITRTRAQLRSIYCIPSTLKNPSDKIHHF